LGADRLVKVGKYQRTRPTRSGATFLREAFGLERSLLGVQLSLSRQSVTHAGVLGEVNENRFIDILRRYLPKRYAVDTGIVLDSRGQTSHQIDVIVYDNQYTPTLLDQENHRFVPAEAVYAVFEVKPAINRTYLTYASKKVASVRRLKRTSVPIKHAGGTHPARHLFDIVGGIIATDLGWKNGFSGYAFAKTLMNLRGNHRIDTGLAVTGGCFDLYDDKLTTRSANNGLTYFLFRLLQKLQSLGTVPAVDWSKYGRSLAK